MSNLNKVSNNYAFIDSQNLNLGVNSQGWQLDFARFRVYLKDKYKVEKAFLFIGYVLKNDKLYNYLRDSGYILVYKPAVKDNHGKQKGNVDAELVLHTMIELNSFDKAVIISGDGDFYCLVEYLESKKKLLKIIVPNHRYSSLLRKFSEKYIVNIALFKSKVGKNKK